MSPLPFQIDLHIRRTMPQFTVRRDSGETASKSDSLYTNEPQYIIQVFCVIFSSISMGSAILTFYWFRRMRRSFYHDLIMFLIQSDMFKALGFMLAPIYGLAFEPVQSSSTFCQVDGFIIALGIEASDFVVLMIAIHSGLSVFQPGATAGAGGLYPYRHVAFVIWIAFPMLMASLAFLNPGNAYETGGVSCFLPTQPVWYNLVLNWIPRYIIFLVILGIYASIYFYVHRVLNGFGRRDNEEPSLSPISTEQRKKSDRLSRPLRHSEPPPTPPLAYHGLIPESRRTSLVQTETRKLSASTVGSCNDQTKIVGGAMRSEPYATRFDGNQSQYSIDNVSIPQVKFGAIGRAPSSTSDPDASPRELASPASNLPSTPTSWTTFAARYTGHVPSIMDVLSFLRSQSHHPATSPWSSTPVYRLEVINSRGQNVDPSDITRDRIRRQLRLLFIYPLVYIGLWVIPFVGNIFKYDALSLDTPVVLRVLVNIIMTIQCAVDCLVFSIREKPWRHIPGSSGGFWESLVFWRGGESGSARGRSWPGKSRAEMAADARAAYRRRDDEVAARIRGIEHNMHGNARRERAERSWWDATPGIDGIMSPAIEEVDPLDVSGKRPS